MKWKGAKSENGRWVNLHRVKWQCIDRQEWCRTLGGGACQHPRQVSFLLCHRFHHLHLRCWLRFRRSDRVVLRPATDWLLNSEVVNNRFLRKVVNNGSLNAAPSQLWFLIVVNNFQWCVLSLHYDWLLTLNAKVGCVAGCGVCWCVLKQTAYMIWVWLASPN